MAMNDPVKAKIIELVPEIREGCKCRTYADGSYCSLPRPITLADVLRAIEMCKGYGDQLLMDSDGSMEYHAVNLLAGTEPENEMFTATWNLTTDFDNQTDELKAFVGKLIGV